MEKNKVRSIHQIKFKYIIDLNVKYEVIQVVEENMGEYLHNLVEEKPNYHSYPDMKKYINKHI